MKIVLLNRSDAHKFPGGDTVQIHAIAKFLKDNGYNVQIEGNFIPKNRDADLVFLFNLTNPFEAYIQFRTIHSNKKPFILFPVYWDLDQAIPINAYPNKIQGLIKLILPESIKGFIRGGTFFLKYYSELKNSNYNFSFVDFINPRKLITTIIRQSTLVCPNSEAEKLHLFAKFPSEANAKTVVIRNGYENIEEVTEGTNRIDKIWGNWVNSPFVCCVGGVGPRKNQLKLVQAMKYIHSPLVIIGKPSAGCEDYYEKVRKFSGSNVIFTGPLERKQVYALLRRATVHVQPSFIETPGLASLEAAALGAQIVVSDLPPVREYFQTQAFYCNPTSISSIVNAIKNALEKGRPNTALQKFVEINYRWEIVLRPLLSIIESIERNE